MSTIIGLVSTFRLPLQRHVRSPKRARKSHRMDVKATKMQAEVQSGR